ncbi:hypothetical protein [Kutzneria buriramensis]|nr:hypothetical protein [Kutzneria buriramensis]
MEVDVLRFGRGELALHLRLWAIALLREKRCDIGLFTAEFGTLDDESQPDKAFAVHQIVWSGEEAQCDGMDPAALNLLATLWSCAGVRLSRT